MRGRVTRSSRFRGRARKKFSQRLTPVPLDPIRYYHFAFGKVNGVECLIARTGYTGEDGFEIYFDPAHSEKLWNDLMHAGESAGLLPCGLGARNTLRLEAGMCLYGHEIDETTTPLEAGLGWICKLDKGPFLGSDVARTSRSSCGIDAQARRLRNARQAHRPRWLSCADRRPRGGTRDQRRPRAVPEEKYRHGVRPARHRARPGRTLEISIRGQAAPARIVALPFYKRPH